VTSFNRDGSAKGFILYAIDNSDLSVLALLNLSAALNTVDHQILLQRLETSFGVGGLALEWFRSYLTNGVLRHILFDSDAHVV